MNGSGRGPGVEVARADGPPPLLAAEGITVAFGGLVAVDGVSFDVPRDAVVSLIGPNGAGKTTLFNALTGLYPLSGGRVTMGTRDITGLAPHAIAAAGLARTFQNIRLFGRMTARENLKVAMHAHLRSGVLRTVLRTPGQRREERWAGERADEILGLVGLLRVAGTVAGALSYGDQRRLEVARALALAPRVLLLDEPTAGMNPRESTEFTEFVRDLRRSMSLSIMVIEHDMSVVMRVSDRVTVLDRGRKIAEGRPEEVRNDERVVTAYLGAGGRGDLR